MKYVHGIGLCLMLSLLVGHASWEPDEAIDAAPFKTKAASIVDLIGKKNENLGFGAALPFNPPARVYTDDDDVYYHVPTILLKDIRNGYMLTFLQPTRQLIEFTNDRIFDDLFGTNRGKLYDQLTIPQWTSEHAIEIGKHFLTLIFDRKDVILGPPYAKYVHQFHQIPKHYTGFWRVGWDRVDEQGRLFTPLEDIWFDIDESRGVFSARIQFPSEYQEESGPILKSDNVLAAAQKAAVQTTEWPLVTQWFQNGKVNPTPGLVTLGVVTPNHLLTSKEILLRHDHNARLAWIFWFAWHPNDDPKQGKPIAVWMDAHTGEYGCVNRRTSRSRRARRWSMILHARSTVRRSPRTSWTPSRRTKTNRCGCGSTSGIGASNHEITPISKFNLFWEAKNTFPTGCRKSPMSLLISAYQANGGDLRNRL